MPSASCSSIDSLVTPYVDGELAGAERETVEIHIRACPPCRARVVSERAGHELVGERTCLYGAGRIAHVMYRHDGHPVSVFMLPDDVRREDMMKSLGHTAAVWSAGGRTFVLLAREPVEEVERMASFVRAGL